MAERLQYLMLFHKLLPPSYFMASLSIQFEKNVGRRSSNHARNFCNQFNKFVDKFVG